ncbi:hypothetical protein GF337_02680, partial [candidate division KSB1 bacterium]|nr:hypothetical protein [candidate division KSB1 bacterium]
MQRLFALLLIPIILCCGKTTPLEPENNPPHKPVPIVPADGKKNISSSINLQWSGGDPDQGDIVTYDIHVGVSDSPDQVKSNSSINSYQTQNLKFSTTYFWKIVSHDNHGNMTSGD